MLLNTNNFKIIIFSFDNSNKNSGGTNVLNSLYNILIKEGYNVINCINHYNINFKIDIDNDISIYPEIVNKNPFRTKKVIRWILAEVGFNTSKDHYKSWGENDLVYYYIKEKRFEKQSEKMGIIYKQLSMLVYSENIRNFNYNQRKNMCHMFRKSHLHSEINHIHDPDSFEITSDKSQDECINIFNEYEYFISYDPLTFYTIIAGVCGCISIIYPIKGMTKTEWLNKSIFGDYLKKNNMNNMYGIAWGKEDIEYARSTLHLLPELMNDIKKDIDNNGTKTFLKDLDEYINLKNCNFENTVKNYYQQIE